MKKYSPFTSILECLTDVARSRRQICDDNLATGIPALKPSDHQLGFVDGFEYASKLVSTYARMADGESVDSVMPLATERIVTIPEQTTKHSCPECDADPDTDDDTVNAHCDICDLTFGWDSKGDRLAYEEIETKSGDVLWVCSKECAEKALGEQGPPCDGCEGSVELNQHDPDCPIGGKP
jgi:hypothetical protein